MDHVFRVVPALPRNNRPWHLPSYVDNELSAFLQCRLGSLCCLSSDPVQHVLSRRATPSTVALRPPSTTGPPDFDGTRGVFTSSRQAALDSFFAPGRLSPCQQKIILNTHLPEIQRVLPLSKKGAPHGPHAFREPRHITLSSSSIPVPLSFLPWKLVSKVIFDDLKKMLGLWRTAYTP